MTRADPPLPTVVTAAAALRAGMTAPMIARRVRSGRWRRLRRGVYCRSDVWEKASPHGRHRLEAKAALLVTQSGLVLSHASAAAWQDLPLPRRGTPVWMTRRPPAAPRYADGLRVLVASLPPQDVSAAGRLTVLPRTVADCLRHLGTADAVSVGDAALRADPGVGAAVAEVLGRCTGWPYAERGRSRLPLLDGRRESPLESASVVAMVSGGIPLPEAQADVFDERGFVGRGDFWWPEFGVIGEADGVVKYGSPAGGDIASARRALLAEKVREDRLRALDARVVRWGWTDLDQPGWSAWLRQQLDLGTPTRFRGRVVVRPALLAGHHLPDARSGAGERASER